MISFCEKEVYVVYEEEINRRQIFSYYLHNDNKTNIILVKNYNEEFAGIITYERILYSGDNFIQREKLYVGADIWDNAYKLLEKDKNIIICRYLTRMMNWYIFVINLLLKKRI